jgi:hypothetical protein
VDDPKAFLAKQARKAQQFDEDIDEMRSSQQGKIAAAKARRSEWDQLLQMDDMEVLFLNPSALRLQDQPLS